MLSKDNPIGNVLIRTSPSQCLRNRNVEEAGSSDSSYDIKQEILLCTIFITSAWGRREVTCLCFIFLFLMGLVRNDISNTNAVDFCANAVW